MNDQATSLSDARYQYWVARAQRESELRSPGMPFDVLMSEAAERAQFARAYWKPQELEDGTQLPGLEAAGSERLPETTPDDIDELRAAVERADDLAMLRVANTAELMNAGRDVLRRLTAAIEWALDDDVDTPEDEQLENVRARHVGARRTTDTLAGQLRDYVALSEEMEPLLATIPAYDPELPKRAAELAEQLRLSRPTRERTAEERAKAFRLRDRLATLLLNRMSRVANAARFVFLDYPDVVRKTQSTYRQNRRAAARRDEQSRSTSVAEQAPADRIDWEPSVDSTAVGVPNSPPFDSTAVGMPNSPPFDET